MKTWKVRTESGNIGKIKLDEYSVYVTEENITVSLVNGTGETCLLYGVISL